FLRNRRRTRPGHRDCARFPFWAPAAVPTLADPAAPGANLVAMRHPATAAGRKTSGVFSKAVLVVGLRGVLSQRRNVTNFLQCSIEMPYSVDDGRRRVAEPSRLHLLRWWIRPGPERPGPFCLL